MQKNAEFDYIIIGQGLAGSALSYHLLRAGKKVLVIDDSESNTSSRVAAGIFNPVTGRKMVKTWSADLLFPYLRSFYKELERECSAEFLKEMTIYRPFTSTEQQNEWMGKSASNEFEVFLEAVYSHSQYPFTYDTYGGVMLRHAGYLDVPVFLKAYRQLLSNLNSLETATFEAGDLYFDENEVRYRNYGAGRLIFCDGPAAIHNKYFHWLPFHPVKGEILYIEADIAAESILNRGVFVIPLGNGLFKVGSTYDHSDLSLTPTETARRDIERRLRELIKVPYKVVGQEAGIRPSSKDRRPFIGLHPEYKPIGVLNGLGTKGVSLAPYFAGHFVDFLENGGQLLPEVNVSRYFSLYYDSVKTE